MRATVKYKPNHQVVVKAFQDAGEAVGKRFGAFVMTTAKQSIRKGKTSKAGDPPRTKQAGSPLKQIRFAYDAVSRSVLIGPIKLSGKQTKDALQVTESGGTATRRVRGGRRVRVKYDARPFMMPALEKRAPELPLLWKNAIKK